MHALPEDPQVTFKTLLAEAHRAKLQGRYVRAITLYEFAQTRSGDNVVIASRLAPLLAHEGRHFEAWRQFQRAGRALMRQDHPEWALSIYREATRMLPLEFDAWRICASIERKLGRFDHALETLLEGRRRFRSALHRDQAIALLGLARKLEPWDPDIVIDLAGLLNQAGQIKRARNLMEELIERSPEADLSRVLAARSRMTWSPGHVWRWLESFVRRFVQGFPPAFKPRIESLQ